MIRHWSTLELRYLEEHAGDGAQAIALALNRSVESVKMQATRNGISLRKRALCPRCGMLTFKPVNRISGFCAECTKELHELELAEQVRAKKAEATRKKRNDRTRQRYYSAKNRAK